MDLIGVDANIADLARLAKLEAMGKMPRGFWAMSMRNTTAYLMRIALLRAVFSVLPYPGPTVTENKL